MFGKSISVNYRGSQSYGTYLSSIVSIGVITLIAINFVLLTLGYHDGSKYEAKSTSIQINGFDSEMYHLNEYNFQVSAFYLMENEKDSRKT